MTDYNSRRSRGGHALQHDAMAAMKAGGRSKNRLIPDDPLQDMEMAKAEQNAARGRSTRQLGAPQPQLSQNRPPPPGRSRSGGIMTDLYTDMPPMVNHQVSGGVIGSRGNRSRQTIHDVGSVAAAAAAATSEFEHHENNNNFNNVTGRRNNRASVNVPQGPPEHMFGAGNPRAGAISMDRMFEEGNNSNNNIRTSGNAAQATSTADAAALATAAFENMALQDHDGHRNHHHEHDAYIPPGMVDNDAALQHDLGQYGHDKVDPWAKHNNLGFAEADVAVAVSVEGRSIEPFYSLTKNKSSRLMEHQYSELENGGFSRGLAMELGESKSLYPVRFWIIDNSGSMMSNDGTMMRNGKSIQCTRWSELQDTVHYHANLAGILQATTIFRMLNDPGVRSGPQQLSVAEDTKNIEGDVQKVTTLMKKCRPAGATPLTAHLLDIADKIALMENEMRQKGLSAAVIIATDGLPTTADGESSAQINEEFIQALRDLQSLPVWVVVRLCTDDQTVVKFYNELDSVLELPLEVLDDFLSEAKEIYQHNKWLNYTMPLHRCRELGYHHRIFDLLDERPLNKDEIREFITLVLGDEMNKAPDVHNDWNGFVKAVSNIVKELRHHWNPMTKKMGPIIDTKQLKRAFGGKVLGIFGKK